MCRLTGGLGRWTDGGPRGRSGGTVHARVAAASRRLDVIVTIRGRLTHSTSLVIVRSAILCQAVKDLSEPTLYYHAVEIITVANANQTAVRWCNL